MSGTDDKSVHIAYESLLIYSYPDECVSSLDDIYGPVHEADHREQATTGLI